MNKELLAKIASGEVSFVSADDGKPLVDVGLIEVNTAIANPNNAAEVACRITDVGRVALADMAAQGAEAQTITSADVGTLNIKPNYQIMTGIALPPAKKRGNTSGTGGGVTKYPFADLPVGGTFFSANVEHKKGDAVKALGSTVSAQNEKYAEPTGEKKTVTRAVRDPQTKKAKLDEAGKKITETVQLDVKKYNRKFAIRPVKAGEVLGSWTAPADGALIGRIV